MVKATFRKYPNPLNTAVKGIDVLDREIKQDGTLHSHRIITSEWGLPNWVSRILGISSSKTCYASELSTIDPSKQEMTLTTKNVSALVRLHKSDYIRLFNCETQLRDSIARLNCQTMAHL